MRILVTGNRGFVGAATAQMLEDAGHTVIGFDIMDCQDIRKMESLESVVSFSQPERILHLAAIARFSEADADPVKAFETNVAGTINVCRIADKYNIPLVYASTGSVYMPITQTPPITEDFKACGNSVYACSKYLGELYVRESRVPWMILRYSHLYGKEKRYHGLIGGFLDRINHGMAPVLYGGKQSNDFAAIWDIARANMMALEASWDKWGQIYNIGTSQELTAEEAGKIICRVFGYNGNIETKEQRTVDPIRFVFDTSKAERMLGFKAEFDFESGLENMAAQMRDSSEAK